MKAPVQTKYIKNKNENIFFDQHVNLQYCLQLNLHENVMI